MFDTVIIITDAEQPPEKVGGCFVPAVPEGSTGGLGCCCCCAG